MMFLVSWLNITLSTAVTIITAGTTALIIALLVGVGLTSGAAVWIAYKAAKAAGNPAARQALAML